MARADFRGGVPRSRAGRAMSGKLPTTITGLSPEPVVRFSYTPY
ncbi:MAG TPA: hypothetical protein VNW89_12330 [Stellaceae bacterium]|nr:hypothetical protein [Stellaceae bacterium]